MSVNRRNRKLGLILFAVYLVLYGSFVLVMAFDAKRLQAIGPGGVNLAVWAGFGLIVIALVLALVYGWMCRSGQGGGEA
ncbi:MAG: hypothetical protein CMJ65_08580 [Planctomycetaceae bacterium]|mgnify:CR=1 FL=1|jgi:uncharacterized membrane protein (DUF485 family)|nr:hypothetical protein [Planctomycetaceae bacterium]MDP7275164.1 DUF485 domain-containing protein [Planctomycetaceae bacterium]